MDSLVGHRLWVPVYLLIVVFTTMGMEPDPSVANVLPGPLVSSSTVTTNSSKCNNSAVNINIQKTIDFGLNINAKGGFCNSTCLIDAVKNGCIKDIESLMLHKADLNVKDLDNKTALMWAITEGNLDIAKLLIERGVDLNVKDNKEIYIFCFKSNICSAIIKKNLGETKVKRNVYSSYEPLHTEKIFYLEITYAWQLFEKLKRFVIGFE